MDIENFRRNYNFSSLDVKDLKPTPFDQFKDWFEEAINSKIIEPNAMALATVSKEGKPSCRMVLMKKFEETGLIFYTNLNSRKAREIKHTGCAAVTFFWKEVERQILIEGVIEEISRAEVEIYFSTRPRGSQISAWASVQDQMIPSRLILEDRYNQIENKYRNQQIPLPDMWGGFRLIPERFEFWQGRQDRLHDRFQYVKTHSGWEIDRISP